MSSKPVFAAASIGILALAACSSGSGGVPSASFEEFKANPAFQATVESLNSEGGILTPADPATLNGTASMTGHMIGNTTIGETAIIGNATATADFTNATFDGSADGFAEFEEVGGPCDDINSCEAERIATYDGTVDFAGDINGNMIENLEISGEMSGDVEGTNINISADASGQGLFVNDQSGLLMAVADADGTAVINREGEQSAEEPIYMGIFLHE